MVNMSNIRALSPELAKKAAEAINEDSKRIADDLAHIKEWIVKQPHLNIPLDDQWLIAFLRGSKYSLERTKRKLDTYYTLRTLVPSFYKNRDPSKDPIRYIAENTTMYLLDNPTDPTGPCISYTKQSFDPKKATIVDLVNYIFTLLDIMMYIDDQCNIAGFVVIADLAGTTISHLTQATPTVIKKVLTVLQDGYPCQMKSIHFINAIPAFDAVLTLARTFASAKLKERFYLHRNLESLCEHIPKSILPPELGGDGENWESGRAKNWSRVRAHVDWINASEEHGSNEKLRPGAPKTTESVFGVEGSFRQLVID